MRGLPGGVVRHLLRLGAFLQREGDKILARLGLNQQQFVVLKEIQEKGPVSQKDICSQFLYEKSNVSKIVAKLRSRGWVAMTSSPRDRRVRALTVTEKGESVIAAGMRALDGWNLAWLEPLRDRDLAQLLGSLQKLDATIPRT